MTRSQIALLTVVLLSSCGDDKKPTHTSTTPQTLSELTIGPRSTTIYSDFPATIEGIEIVQLRPMVDGYLEKPLLTAGQEVSNALFDYQSATTKIQTRAHQIHFLQKSVDYTKELMRADAKANYTDVLTSEQNLLSAQLAGVDDHLQQLQSIVTLYTSLGGGWK